MKPCSQAYCPNAAGPSGVCDDCQGERRGGMLRPGVTKVKNETGKREYILTAAEWQAIKDRM